MRAGIVGGGMVAVLVGLTAGCGGGVPPDEALEAVRRGGGEFASLGPRSESREWERAAEHYYRPAYRDYFEDMDAIADHSLDFATGQGDPLSFCEDPQRALRQLRRVLKPGAALVLSVDNRCAGVRTLLDEQEPAAALELLRSGRTEWRADRDAERFGMKMFDAAERLVVCNSQYYNMYELTSEDAKPGSTLSEVLQKRVAKGTF